MDQLRQRAKLLEKELNRLKRIKDLRGNEARDQLIAELEAEIRHLRNEPIKKEDNENI